MKICFIGPSVGTNNESQETVIYHMARCLSERHDVTLITGRSRTVKMLKRFENAPFEVVTVPYWPRNTTLNRITSRIVKRLHPWKIESFTLYFSTIIRPSVKRKVKEADVICAYYRLDSRLFSNLAYRYGTPCVSNFQFATYNQKFFDIDKSVMYLANSKFSKDSLESNLDITVEGIVSPGISSELFQDTYRTIPEMKNGMSLLFVGHLRRQKGVYELVDIFKKVSGMHESSRLFIIGSGVEKEALEQKIQTLDLSEKVRFVGRVDFEDMPSYYKSATLLVHPTHEETFGMVVLEAMAAGLPVVATDLPALREVSEGAADLLPMDDLNSWVEKIDIILKQEKTREEMAQKGKVKAREHLWSKKGEQLERYLEKASQFKGKLK